jgi:hypothetical protein
MLRGETEESGESFDNDYGTDTLDNVSFQATQRSRKLVASDSMFFFK